MNIDALSEQTDMRAYSFRIEPDCTHWNGREIERMEGMKSLVKMTAFSNVQETHRPFVAGKIARVPNGARAPDESRLEFEGGYNEEKGGYIEGKWTLTWTSKDDRDSSENNNESTVQSDSPDSRDRDSDKDLDNK